MHGDVLHGKTAPSLVSLVSIAILVLSGAAAHGQSDQTPAAGQAQPPRMSKGAFDIGVSGYEAFNHSTTANGVVQTPINAPGGMIEFRYIQRPLVGFELTYGYNKGDQTIGPSAPPSCGLDCATPAQKLNSSNSLVGLDWVFSKQFGNLRPFAAAGIGFFIDEPGNSTFGINDTVRIAYLYGGGADFSLSTHFGLRAQYRVILYKTPDLSMLFPAQGVYTTTSEPAGGVFYRF